MQLQALSVLLFIISPSAPPVSSLPIDIVLDVSAAAGSLYGLKRISARIDHLQKEQAAYGGQDVR